jgi:intron-binding protein aquarius
MDIISSRCGDGTPLAGIRPKAVSTVDQYQGQQNDYILLSLVRTESIGHLRDVRRLVVAVSRARLGLYVFCRQPLFASSHDLKPTMDQFASRPNRLALVLGETFPCERQQAEDEHEEAATIPSDKVLHVENVEQFGALVHQMQEDFIQAQQAMM